MQTAAMVISILGAVASLLQCNKGNSTVGLALLVLAVAFLVLAVGQLSPTF